MFGEDNKKQLTFSPQGLRLKLTMVPCDTKFPPPCSFTTWTVFPPPGACVSKVKTCAPKSWH